MTLWVPFQLYNCFCGVTALHRVVFYDSMTPFLIPLAPAKVSQRPHRFMYDLHMSCWHPVTFQLTNMARLWVVLLKVDPSEQQWCEGSFSEQLTKQNDMRTTQQKSTPNALLLHQCHVAENTCKKPTTALEGARVQQHLRRGITMLAAPVLGSSALQISWPEALASRFSYSASGWCNPVLVICSLQEI